MSQKEPVGLTVVPNDRILMQQEAAWYYGGYTTFDRVALGHLIVTERKILFFEQRPVALSQLFTDVAVETLRLAFALPLNALRSAKIETRIRSRGSRPVWRDTQTHGKIMKGEQRINRPPGVLERKEEYPVLIVSLAGEGGGVDSLVFEVVKPIEWMGVLKRGGTAPEEREMKEVADRIRTGVGVLDELLGGGVPKGYNVLLSSPSCDEKDLLVRRLLERVSEDGGVAIYVCVDPSKMLEPAGKHPENIRILACNPRAELLPQGAPNVESVRGLENLSDVNIGLLRIIDSLAGGEIGGGRLVCIDVLSEVLLQQKLLNTRRWLLDLLPRLRHKGYTVLATFNPYMHSPEEAQAVADVLDGEISLSDKEGSDAKQIRVKKMFNLDYSKRTAMLDRAALMP